MHDRIDVEIDGQELQILAEVIEKKIWFRLNGENFAWDLTDLSDSAAKRNRNQGKTQDRITAPMPGKLTKIFVSEGARVTKGDALLVMEAMKMEYTLKSDIDGTVESLPVKVGDQVTLGQLLVQLKESK